MTITKSDFDFVRDLVRRESAIVLEPGKEYLVEARLSLLAKSTGHNDLASIVRELRAAPTTQLSSSVIDSMTTNETSFLRDVAPFDALVTSVLPDLIKQRAAEQTLTIWSAACSSGQEPYSIAMLIRSRFPELASWRIKILATDVSGDMLAKAKAGRFAQIEVNRGLPAALLAKYFSRTGMGWDVSPEIRSMVEFRQLNLVRPIVGLPLMDIVFLRNVLIYFDVPTKQAVVEKVARMMAPGGYLFLGAAESLVNVHDGFVPGPFERAGCYTQRNATS